MPTENINLGIATSVASFREAQRNFVNRLETGVARVRPKNRIAPILRFHQREIDRQLSGDPGSVEHFDELRVIFYELAVVLTFHIRHLEFLKGKGKKPSRDARLTTRFLNAAFDDVMAGLDDLGTRFVKRPLKNRVHQIIGRVFPALNSEQIDKDVEAIRAFITKAVAEKEQNAA